MSVVESGKCKIEWLNSSGMGVANLASGQIELPYTIKGETVIFEKHKYRNQTNSINKGILHPSIDRIKPICKYFGACGGCLLQHLSDTAHIEFKENLIRRALKSAGINTHIRPIITIKSATRRRANFQAVKKNDQIFLGFRRLRSHQIINIDTCIALLPQLSDLIPIIKLVLQIIFFDKQKAQIFVNYVYNGIDMIIDTTDLIVLGARQKLQILDLVGDRVIRLQLRNNGKSETVILTEKPQIRWGNISVDTNADSFLQTSSEAETILQNLVITCFADECDQDNTIVDLFCGRGTFSIPLSQYFLVDGFESDDNAVLALDHAITQCASQRINVTRRDLYTSPIRAAELNKYKYAVLNPPRLGAKKQCAELAMSCVKKAVYISCNPQSFIRDALILCKAGYQLSYITPVDQFYWNPHLEIVALFVRKDYDHA